MRRVLETQTILEEQGKINGVKLVNEFRLAYTIWCVSQRQVVTLANRVFQWKMAFSSSPRIKRKSMREMPRSRALHEHIET